MFLLTQQTQHVQDSTADHEDGEQAHIGYGDDGLQQQLLDRHRRSSSGTGAPAVAPVAPRSQHAAQQQRPGSLSGGLAQFERHESPPRCTAAQEGVHDLLDDLLTQAQATTVQQPLHQHPQHAQRDQHANAEDGDATQANVQHQQEQQEVQQQVPPSAAGVFRTHRQLLSNLLQPPSSTRQQQQHQQQQPEGGSQQPPPAPTTGKQQKQRSVLYSNTSARNASTTTPGAGRVSSTPQRPAPKKKARFSIKDTPPLPTPPRFATPQQPSRKKPAAGGGGATAATATAAGAGSGSKSLASLLGNSAATPSRQPAVSAGGGAIDSSRTPMQHQQQHSPTAGLAALFTTPGPSNSNRPAAAAAGQPAAEHTTPEAAAGTRPAFFAEDDQPAAETPAAAAGAAAGAGSSGGSSRRSSKRRATEVNPLEVMSASRQRQRAFLERLPTTPAASGPDLAGLQQLSSLCVPLGTNLSKVWQQLQDVRKKQQDRLDENPGCDTGALELEVVNKALEAHLVKCCCTVTRCPPSQQQEQQQQTQQQQTQQQQDRMLTGSNTQAAPQAAQQQQQPRVGDRVFVVINSKTSHCVELQRGSRFKVHPPWHIVALPQPGSALVLLAHVIS